MRKFADFNNKKAGMNAGLSVKSQSDADQYRATTGPPQLKR
jgi:hypothetical protein